MVMKLYPTLRILAPMIGFGAFLIFVPSARAQADVAPDHFDGTDPWEIALAAKSHRATPSNAKPATLASAGRQQSAAKSQLQNQKGSAQPEVLAVDDKRKLPARKSGRR